MTDRSQAALKPCPECGGWVNVYGTTVSGVHGHHFACIDCGWRKTIQQPSPLTNPITGAGADQDRAERKS